MDVSWRILVITELVEATFTPACAPYPRSNDLENVRSIETVWELVTVLVLLLTGLLFSTSHFTIVTSEHFNATSRDRTTACLVCFFFRKLKTKTMSN